MAKVSEKGAVFLTWRTLMAPTLFTRVGVLGEYLELSTLGNW